MDLTDAESIKTLEGTAVVAGVNAAPAGYTINGANITTTDLYATNGVVHVIDAVLIPDDITIPTQTIADLAAATPDLSTLVAALKDADLVSTLEGTGPFTVFAPSNAAFAKLPSLYRQLLLDPKNVKQLQKLLTYHVVAGAAVFSKDLKDKEA